MRRFVLGFMVMIFSVMAVVGLIYYFPQPEPTLHEYNGLLESISYVHQGSFNSISRTILHFSDGSEFYIQGHHVFQLGQWYQITWETLSPSLVRDNVKVEMVKNE